MLYNVTSKQWQFYFFLSSLDSFLFLVWLLWWGLPIQSWINVTRVSILVLFLILEEMLSAFHHWVWCWLWVCHIWPLLCWSTFSLYSLCLELIINGCWILSKAFSASVEMIMVFILEFVSVVYCIDWFVGIEPSLHSWDKSHLIMVYGPFNVLLNLVC